MNFYKQKCYARVILSHDVLKELSDDELLRLYEALGVVMRVEDRFYSMTTELVVAHPRFPKLSEGEIIPLYKMQMRIGQEGKLEFIFLPDDSDIERCAGDPVI